MGPDLTRRRLLGLGLAGGAGAALGGLGLPLPVSAASAARRSDPVSMAMHVHASFSEGPASMGAQLEQARRCGIDVLWWTEHDFRMTGHGYRKGVGFNGRDDTANDVAWRWEENTSGPVEVATGTFVGEGSPDEEGGALRLQARGPAEEWGSLVFSADAWNHTYTTNISDTTLVLDVLAEELGRDAQLVVEAQLSYHPATGDRPAGRYALQYRVGANGDVSREDGGLLGVVPLEVGTDWQRLRMTLAEDVAAVWPDLVAGDHALTGLSVGVRVRRGATARAVVDRLRFRRTGRGDAVALQRALVDEYAGRYPDVVQYQGAELSLVRHLNVFGGKQVLPHYAQEGPRKDPELQAALDMVAWARKHRGLVSWNHPLEGLADGAAELARTVVQTRNLGADLIEVGSPQDLTTVAAAFDVAARNSIFVTATGVSDDHSGRDWETRRARWITSTWAGSTQEDALLAAVGAGRAWFWDLAGWRGTMDLSVQGRPAMGGVLVTADPVTTVEVLVDDLPAGGDLEVVVGRVDDAGARDLTPATTSSRAGRQLSGGRASVDVRPGSYVRAAVRDAAGTVVGFSNPVWVLGAEPATGIPADRRL